MNTSPDASILGLGYLGRPLAQKLYEHGSRVAAVKRSLTSDDINLPIRLDTLDLNQDSVFQSTNLAHDTSFWRHHADKPVWFCLLPPSSLTHYADTVKQWAELARACNVQHLIFTSSTSVYGDKARECDETSASANRVRPPNPCCRTIPARQRRAEHRHPASGRSLLHRTPPRQPPRSKTKHPGRQPARQYRPPRHRRRNPVSDDPPSKRQTHPQHRRTAPPDPPRFLYLRSRQTRTSAARFRS